MITMKFEAFVTEADSINERRDEIFGGLLQSQSLENLTSIQELQELLIKIEALMVQNVRANGNQAKEFQRKVSFLETSKLRLGEYLKQLRDRN